MDGPRAFQVNETDNVATMLADVHSGPVLVYGCLESRTVQALESISLGHKIAVAPIAAGVPVIKYGVPIGIASANILEGQWVHLHNCGSALDERSNHLDVETGVALDTPYA